MVDRVNGLDADIVVPRRRYRRRNRGTCAAPRPSPLAAVRAELGAGVRDRQPRVLQRGAGLARLYGEHRLGRSLHNRHIVDRARRVTRLGRRRGRRRNRVRLPDCAAGTARIWRRHCAGTDPPLPVLLLAHQPKRSRRRCAAGVDLQISGHTHERTDLAVQLSGPARSAWWCRAQRGTVRAPSCYPSRGTGFWGPPFQVFAPSEILLTLRARSLGFRHIRRAPADVRKSPVSRLRLRRHVTPNYPDRGESDWAVAELPDNKLLYPELTRTMEALPRRVIPGRHQITTEVPGDRRALTGVRTMSFAQFRDNIEARQQPATPLRADQRNARFDGS